MGSQKKCHLYKLPKQLLEYKFSKNVPVIVITVVASIIIT